MNRRFLIRLYLIWKYVIVLNKPLYLFRLLTNVLGKFSNIKNPLRGIDFAINYECNMKCKHCFDEGLKKDKSARRMSVDDYRRVAREAMDLGCTYFGFQGGEVFLNKRYLEIIQAVNPKKNRITITTNGFGVNEIMIRRLKEVDVDYLNFSLDSIIPEEHDSFRRMKGSFQSAMEAIKVAQKLRMKVTINAVVYHVNLHTEGFKDLVEFANKNKILINTLFATPSGQWEGNKDVLLNKKDIEDYNALRKRYPFMVRDIDSGFRGSGCPAVKEALYITPYGDVLGCPFIHISLGNVLDEPLDSIRLRGLNLSQFNYYHHYHPNCLIAEDENFIKEYLSLIKDKGRLPVQYQELL